MHGLMNRAIEGFVRQGYGAPCWRAAAGRIGLEEDGFQPFRRYPFAVTRQLTAAVGAILDKPEAEVIEDVGAWLARVESVRRLLRFSGSDFSDFVLSLEELPGRIRMVLPDLEAPEIAVAVHGPQAYRITLAGDDWLWRALIAGMLRAMSDDYGALALIVDEDGAILVDVSDASFGNGRGFDLAAGAEAAGGWR